MMLVLAILMMIATSPGQTHGITFFNAKFRETFALSHTRLSSIYFVATLLAAGTLPACGAMIDRYGLRKSTLVSLGLMALACFYVSQVQGAITLMIAFMVLRGIGSGALVLLANNTLAAWFDRRLGLAIGIMQVTLALATSVVLEGVVALIDYLDWRGAYMAIGALVGGCLLPLTFCAYYQSPSDKGQFPDGAQDSEHILPISLQGLTLREASRHVSYWILLTATGIWTLVAGGLLFHLEEIFRLQGLTVDRTLMAVRFLAVAMAVTQVIGGFLADFLPMRWLIMAAMWLLATCCGLIACEESKWLITGCTFFGMAQGLMTIVAGTAWARFFGRAHLGKIRGTSVTAGVIGSSIGPLVMGISVDHFGSFAPSLWIIAGCSVALGFLALGVKLVTIDDLSDTSYAP
jgi:MFS family permease